MKCAAARRKSNIDYRQEYYVLIILAEKLFTVVLKDIMSEDKIYLGKNKNGNL